jgi:hypothetical protein
MRSRQFRDYHRNKPAMRKRIRGGVEESRAAQRGPFGMYACRRARQLLGIAPGAGRRDLGHAEDGMFAAAGRIIFSNAPP